MHLSAAQRLLATGWITGLAIATYLSLMPAARLGQLPGTDKHWHFGGYLLLALPLAWIFARRPHVAVAAAGLVIYSGLIEIAQHFVPGRSMDPADLLANTLGVLAGAGLGMLVAAQLPGEGIAPAGD